MLYSESNHSAEKRLRDRSKELSLPFKRTYLSSNSGKLILRFDLKQINNDDKFSIQILEYVDNNDMNRS